VYRGKEGAVWTILKGDTLHIESGKEIIASCPIKTDYLDAFHHDN
jgi:hypothetical protein